MKKLLSTVAIVWISGLALHGCTQTEGERCQLADDCSPLLCVDSSGPVSGGESGHCCPECPANRAEYWDVESAQCACTTGTPDGDGDGDADGDGDGDADSDSDSDSDGEIDADV